MNSFLKSKKDIKAWLNRYGIENYRLIPDKEYGFIVNVEGHVNLSNQKLTHIPIKFNYVNGDFWCCDNDLIALSFCPHTVNGAFNCSNNQLCSLIGVPHSVGSTFNCGNNSLVSLVNGPKNVGLHYFCNSNHLASLEGSPCEINGIFSCQTNQLTSLEHVPRIIKRFFSCENNKIRTLDFCPEFVGSHFLCDNNPALGDIQKLTEFKEIYALHKTITATKKEKDKLSQEISTINAITPHDKKLPQKI